jgi:hypothetical protein
MIMRLIFCVRHRSARDINRHANGLYLRLGYGVLD